MIYQTFANLPFPVSRIGMGCSAAWAKPWYLEADAKSLVSRAIEAGINHFDTGSNYSAGLAEQRLGAALKGRDTTRFLISTKAGTHLNASGRIYKDFSPAAIRRSVDTSLQRLGLDVIPLLYLHFPVAKDLTDALLALLEDLRREGKVRLLGVNSFDESVLEVVGEIQVFDAVMPDYNLLRVSREEIIDRLSEKGKTVVAGSPLANLAHAPGFLFPKSRADIWYSLRAIKNYRDFLRARRLRGLSANADWSPAQIAMSFVLQNRHVASAVFGTTRAEHLNEIVETVERDLPIEIVSRIRSQPVRAI